MHREKSPNLVNQRRYSGNSQGQHASISIGLNLLMIALSYLNIKQNETGQWYIDSWVAANVTSDAGKLLNLFFYTDHGSIVTEDGTHHPISH